MRIPLTYSYPKGHRPKYLSRYYFGPKCLLTESDVDIRMFTLRKERTIYRPNLNNYIVKNPKAFIDTGASLVILPKIYKNIISPEAEIPIAGGKKGFLILFRIQQRGSKKIQYVSSIAYFGDDDKRTEIILGMDFIREFIFSLNIVGGYFELKPHKSIYKNKHGEYIIK